MLGKYGDPSYLTLPIGFKNHPNCDMSFTGLKTAITGAVSTTIHLSLISFWRDQKILLFLIMKDNNFNCLLSNW